MGKYHFPRNTPFQDRLKRTEQGCLEWQGARTSLGYGTIKVGKKTYKAHRWFFEQAHGYEPNVVRHTCDNPSCCNLDHLIDGTQAENLADCIQKRAGAAECIARRKTPFVETHCNKCYCHSDAIRKWWGESNAVSARIRD